MPKSKLVCIVHWVQPKRASWSWTPQLSQDNKNIQEQKVPKSLELRQVVEAAIKSLLRLHSAQHLRRLRFVFGNEPLIHLYWKATDQMGFPNILGETTFKHDFIHICWWQFSSWVYKQATVEGNNDDHPDGGKMRQSNWPTCPEANHRIVQKWMLMWLVSKTRCILVYKCVVIPTKRCSMLYNGVWITSCHLSHRVWYNVKPWPSLATV